MAGQRLDRVRLARVMQALRSGMNPYAAARASGVSPSFTQRLHQSLGGMYRPTGSSYSSRFLGRDERYEIARLREAGCSMRMIATALGRSPSTISRELARNSIGRPTRTGAEGRRYEPERADTLAWQRQRRPRRTLWHSRPRLREVVQSMLTKRLSPEQISGRLRLDFPIDDPDHALENQFMQVSHESIYRALYVYPRGELTRELKAVLRSRRSTRRPHGRQERRGKIADMVSIHDRPEEVAGRLVPGHHEGDLIKGTTVSNSAIGTIVERHSGYVTLLHLPEGWAAEKVAAAVITQMSQYPTWFAKTLTWDRGTEMSQHKKITQAGIQVYFADPHCPQQRPSNENTNGLLREYFPKSTDLSVHDADHLQFVADELNDRPRKRLGFLTPAEVFATLQAEAGVATTA